MFRVLAIFCLVAASAFGLMEKGFKMTFGIDPTKIGSSIFVALPETKADAINKGWVNTPRAPGPAGYEKLTLVCLPNDYTLCLYFDETGIIMGYQIAFDLSRFSNQVFDWYTSGFKNWTVCENGEKITLVATSVFFACADYLAKDPAIRVSERDETMILQDSKICVTGFYGDLVPIPKNTTQLESENVFTLQGFMQGMGYHRYYQMTKTLPCGDTTMLTYFLYFYDDQLIGIAFMLPGKYVIPTGQKDWFERPTKALVKIIVPNGPDCLGEYGDNIGILTMHSYFVKEPYNIKNP